MTIIQRSVVIRMRRRAPDEHVEPFRHRTHGPTLEAVAEEVHAWVAAHAEQLADRLPEMPKNADGSEIQDRDQDVWEPLLAIADQAGGHWPHTARAACVNLLSTAGSPESGSLGIRLLHDLRTVFRDKDAMHSQIIINALHDLDESPWEDLRGKPLDARGLAHLLKPYEVSSVDVRLSSGVKKGYRRADLHDTWKRYLPAEKPDDADDVDEDDEDLSQGDP